MFLDLFRGIKFGSRSPQWSQVRNDFIKENPFCAVCESKGSLLNGLEAHHLVPFSVNPELELDKNNLVTLCRNHHLTFGHLMSWKSYNQNAVEDIKEWNSKIKNRP